jgi:dipeptidase
MIVAYLWISLFWVSVNGIVITEDRCTATAVAKKAGVNGPMTSHTADCADCDFRINKRPSMDWPKGSMRPCYAYKGNYPAIVSSVRGGKTWLPENLEGTKEQISVWKKQEKELITGYIPQVEHTYAIYEAGYGIMNEHQLAIGESTCAAKLYAAPTIAGGKAILDVRELSQIALERTKTARDAIQTMGSLAEKYGYYSADWVSENDARMGEGGEALTVIDKTEAWVFHILPDDTGTTAVWAAQRVPDDHIAAVANQFVIREIDPASPDFMASSNIREVAIRTGLWKPQHAAELLNFVHTFGPPRAHSSYANRRVWRIFSLANPNLNLPADTNSYADDYPFSVPVARPLSAADIMALNRDHYEGTPFDLTKGLAAGPYGDPNRWDVSPVEGRSLEQMLQGGFERSIGLFRTSYSFVAESREAVPDWMSMMWFSQHAAFAASYVPLYLVAEDAPQEYRTGSLFTYDSSVAFWNFCAAGNYAARFYEYAMEDLRTLQRELETKAFKLRRKVEEESIIALSFIKDASSTGYTFAKGGFQEKLAVFTADFASETVSQWAALLPKLITKYHDGYIAHTDSADINMQKIFYPIWWLKAVGYFNEKPATGPGVILFNQSPIGPVAGGAVLGTLAWTAVVAFIFYSIGAGRIKGWNNNPRHEYEMI